MNFKRNLGIIITALVGTLALTSCSFGANSSFKRFEFLKEQEDKMKNDLLKIRNKKNRNSEKKRKIRQIEKQLVFSHFWRISFSYYRPQFFGSFSLIKCFLKALLTELIAVLVFFAIYQMDY